MTNATREALKRSAADHAGGIVRTYSEPERGRRRGEMNAETVYYAAREAARLALNALGRRGPGINEYFLRSA